MQTTLLGIGVLPPPTAGPYIFSGLYGTGAGLTANGREAFVVQYIIGHLVFVNVGPNLFFAPAGKGVYFDQTVVFIPFYQGNVFACNGLSRPKTANPGIQFGKGTLQGFYFPQVTAKLPVLLSPAENRTPAACLCQTGCLGLRSSGGTGRYTQRHCPGRMG